MDVFDYAIDLEKEGESLYRRMAKETKNAALKNILGWLADEELKHIEMFQEMKAGRAGPAIDKELLKKAKNVFIEMDASGKDMIFNSSITDLYQKAKGIEKKSRDFYIQKSKELNDLKQKEAILSIADQEGKHFFLIDNIIEFISRPQTWLEDAEFNHLDEY